MIHPTSAGLLPGGALIDPKTLYQRTSAQVTKTKPSAHPGTLPARAALSSSESGAGAGEGDAGVVAGVGDSSLSSVAVTSAVSTVLVIVALVSGLLLIVVLVSVLVLVSEVLVSVLVVLSVVVPSDATQRWPASRRASAARARRAIAPGVV